MASRYNIVLRVTLIEICTLLNFLCVLYFLWMFILKHFMCFGASVGEGGGSDWWKKLALVLTTRAAGSHHPGLFSSFLLITTPTAAAEKNTKIELYLQTLINFKYFFPYKLSWNCWQGEKLTLQLRSARERHMNGTVKSVTLWPEKCPCRD